MAFGALTRRNNPWDDLMTLQQEMNWLLESSLGPATGADAFSASGHLLPIDVLRNHEQIIIRADVPGISKDDLEVTVLKNRLYIRGEKKHTNDLNQENAHRLERFYGTFERSLDLPVPVNPEDIKASFKDGVLEIIAPVAEEAKPRSIAVEVNG